MTAVVFDIIRHSYVDGPGIRTAVFFKGCNLRCAWCHNPESQSAEKQLLFFAGRCTHCGKCRSVCPFGLQACNLCGACALHCPAGARRLCGREMTAEEIAAEAEKDADYYAASGGGVTLSGGEPLLNADFAAEVAARCRARGLSVAVDTAGNVPYEAFEKTAPYTDLFLFDVKCFDAGRHRAFTGADNARILSNLRRLLERRVPLWIRIPVIPGFNDRAAEMKKIAAFIRRRGTAEKIELLPYHALGEHKYAALGRPVPHFSVPTPAVMAELKACFADCAEV